MTSFVWRRQIDADREEVSFFTQVQQRSAKLTGIFQEDLRSAVSQILSSRDSARRRASKIRSSLAYREGRNALIRRRGPSSLRPNQGTGCLRAFRATLFETKHQGFRIHST